MAFPVRVAHLRRALVMATRPEQFLRSAKGTSPGIVAEQWSQPRAQKAYPFDAAHSIALALCTYHVRSLRKVAR